MNIYKDNTPLQANDDFLLTYKFKRESMREPIRPNYDDDYPPAWWAWMVCILIATSLILFFY